MEAFVEKYFIRFSRSQRIQHLILFVGFLGLGLTGMPQLFASNGVAQGWLNLLGGAESARTIHHICGAVLIILGVYHILELLLRAVMGKGSTAMIPQPYDVKTAIQNIKYYLGLRDDPPEYDRYGYMEKMEYLSLIWGTLVMAATGLILWFPLVTIEILPGQAIPVATAIHQWEAILAGLYVLIVHMYFAHFKPESFPYHPMMTDGHISEHHLKEEHPREYERVTGHTILASDDESSSAKDDHPSSDPPSATEASTSSNEANEARRKAIM